MSPQKRQRGHGVFQQRANIETALNFLKKSVSFQKKNKKTTKMASVSAVCFIALVVIGWCRSNW